MGLDVGDYVIAQRLADWQKTLSLPVSCAPNQTWSVWDATSSHCTNSKESHAPSFSSPSLLFFFFPSISHFFLYCYPSYSFFIIILFIIPYFHNYYPDLSQNIILLNALNPWFASQTQSLDLQKTIFTQGNNLQFFKEYLEYFLP